MVGVEVCEEYPVEAVDPEGVQTVGERLRPSPHVDECAAVAVPEHERVALTYVARRDDPVPWTARRESDLPAAERTRIDGGSTDERDRRRRGDRPWQAPPRRHKRDRDEDECAQSDTEEAVRPRQSRTGKAGREPGDHGDPGRGQPGDPDHGLADRGRPRQEKAGQAPEDRGDRRGRLGYEVCRHPEERERRRQQEEHRLARELRRQRHCERHGDPAWKPPRQSGRQRSCEQQQPGGRESGEREAVVAGEPGIVDEQHDHRQSKSGEAVRDPAAREPEEDDRRHRRGAKNAGPRTNERNERRERCGSGHDAGAAPEADTAGEQEHETGDERAVRPGHRCQVAQSRGLHRLVEFGGDGCLVADRQTRQQVAAIARRDGCGTCEGVAHGRRPGQPEGRAVAHPGSGRRAKGERGRLARLVRSDGHARRDDRAERELAHGWRIAGHHQRDRHPAADDVSTDGSRRGRPVALGTDLHRGAAQPPLLDPVESGGGPARRTLDPDRDLHATMVVGCGLERRVGSERRLRTDHRRAEG